MTSPPEPITVACPACGARYDDWHRPSINLALDPELADPAYMREASTATCPACGHVVELDVLVVERTDDGGEVWRTAARG
jgi:hypothetical protein